MMGVLKQRFRLQYFYLKILAMKNLFLKATLLLSFFTPATAALHAQNEDDVHRYLSVGVRSSVFSISELPVTVVPANRLLLSIDPVKYLRIEGHFAYYANQNQQVLSIFPTGTTVLTLKEHSALIGGGIFGIYPVHNIRFSAGVRFSQNNYDLDDINFSSGAPSVVTDKGKIKIVAGVLGGEYLFGKWFSVGAEFNLVNMNDRYDPADNSLPVTTSKTTITESTLVFRFYPF
jgi:hypothetical protein